MTKRKALGETQWLAAGSTYALLRQLTQHHRAGRTSAGRRRLRLFACFCCRRLWHLFADPQARQAVEVAERFADGQASLDELVAAGRSAGDAERSAMNRIRELTGGRSWPGPLPASLEAAHHARAAAAAAVAAATTAKLAEAAERAALQCVIAAGVGRDRWDDGRPVQHAIEAMQCDLLRDIFGNPFRPVAIDPVWLTWHGGVLVSMAQKMYDSREFSDMPILADALEEAGCTDADLLGHCRSAGEHVRSCWVVDLLLGKE
jgi:hypothetical protein